MKHDRPPIRLHPPEDEDDLVGLRELAARLWRGRWMILLAGLLAAAAAFVLTARLPDRYTATARVMFAAEKPNVIDLKDILADPAFSKDTLQNEVEVLRSTSLLNAVVAELGLAADPEFNPALREPGRLAAWLDGLTPPDWLARLALRVAPDAAAPAPDPVVRQRQLVTGAVLDALTLRPIEGTRVIEIAVTAGRPETAAAISNAIAGQYLLDQLSAKTDTTRRATEWLATRVEDARAKVQAAEDAVEAARAELSDQSGQGLDISEQQLATLNEALAAARGRSAQADARHRRLAEALAAGTDLASVNEFRDAAPIVALRETEADLATRLAGLSPRHPSRSALTAELAATRAKMQAEAAALVDAAGLDADSAHAEEASLGAAVRSLETKTLGQSREDLRLRQLEREADADRLIYETMLNRLKEAGEQVDLQAPNARVLSPADPPLAPDQSRRLLVVALAGLVGLAAGAVLALVLDLLDATFRAPQQVELVTGRPVLATIPSIGTGRSRAEVLARLSERPNSSLAEAVRNLRTSLLHSNLDHPPRVVMFTSTVPQEGKTVTALLTALASIQMGRTAVVVDCDLRRSPATATLRPGAHRLGLLSVLDGTATLDEAVFHDPVTGLHALLARPEETRSWLNAADVLASSRFATLLGTLSERYDLVILDTPPTLVVSDARILSTLCDAVVYCARWAGTPRGAVIEGLRELETVDAPIAGVVVTLLNEHKAARSSFDGYVYYRGRYRDYYAN
ncbi:MAG: Wzz/FepE/Etk N-terminal domain-containing protein [Amaricoccus sp.]|uniref:GumC family protein n=1 Tax=Amaricoccus sp. TaxID=1872485 RepID=UPI0039E4109A